MVRLEAWSYYLLIAKERESHEESPFSGVMTDLAADWKTCAVGELCQLWGPPWSQNIGRPVWAEHMPRELLSLGVTFGEAVSNEDLHVAQTIFDEIERYPKPMEEVELWSD